jgi:DNA-binding response OmpR family regulator
MRICARRLYRETYGFMRLLLVEDDELLGDGIQAGLSQDGYTVDWVVDGQRALDVLRREEFALVVLDIGLPYRSGLDVLRCLRKEGSTVPILILTARDTLQDRVEGLDAGADDYLVKPFDLPELLARLRALRRRQAGRPSNVIVHGELMVDSATHSVRLSGEPVLLSRREFALLTALLENRGRVLSKERLEDNLYGWEGEVESNALEVHVHHLRRKLGNELIRTVRGVGYTILDLGAAGK